MQRVEIRPDFGEGLRVAEGAETRLALWLQREINGAFSNRSELDAEWKEALKTYEAVPERKAVTFPFENAPNIVVPLGAIACDSIYAQSLDLIFSVAPVVTVQALDERYIAEAKAVQRFVNWMTVQELGFSAAARQAILDDVQLGTGIYYVPWVKEVRKGRVHQILREGPRCYAIPPEDFLIAPGATDDLQAARWVAVRFWLGPAEFEARAGQEEWTAERKARAHLGAKVDEVRLQREQLGHEVSSDSGRAELYQLFDVYCSFDIDGDGYEEDLLVTWDRGSGAILHLRYNPYDRRPFEAMRYQERGHLFYGLGVLEMLKGLQGEATLLHNHRTANLMLANTRIWAARQGSVPDSIVIHPGKVVQLPNPEDLNAIAMADVYPSASQGQAITMGLAERRTGVNEMSLPRASSVMGSRTPGITALSMLQATNRRFTSVFDGLRMASGAAVKQGLYRYQEKLLERYPGIEDHARKVLGERDGALFIAVVRDTQFDDALKLELTTSSASVSRDADRQNALMLMQMLSTYYQRTLELVSVGSNPQVPEPVRIAAGKIAGAASELMERLVRTFDQVRDPGTLIVDVSEEIGGGAGGGAEQQMAGGVDAGFGALAQLLGMPAGAVAGNGAEGDVGAELGGVPAA